jgi:hypothetical protein
MPLHALERDQSIGRAVRPDVCVLKDAAQERLAVDAQDAVDRRYPEPPVAIFGDAED